MLHWYIFHSSYFVCKGKKKTRNIRMLFPFKILKTYFPVLKNKWVVTGEHYERIESPRSGHWVAQLQINNKMPIWKNAAILYFCTLYKRLPFQGSLSRNMKLKSSRSRLRSGAVFVHLDDCLGGWVKDFIF